MTRRPRSHQLETLASNRLREIFGKANWVMEELTQDYGEDFRVRIFDEQEATPWTFLVQSKGTDNLGRFRRKNGHYLSYQVDLHHLRQWERYSEPVFITLWDARSGVTFWELIQENLQYFPEKTKKTTTHTIKIPMSQTLSHDVLWMIRSLTRVRLERFEKTRRDIRELLDALEAEWGVRIEYTPGAEVAIVPEGRFVHSEPQFSRALFLGDAARLAAAIREANGAKTEEFLDQVLLMLWKDVQLLSAGGRLQIDDEVFHDVPGFARYLNRLKLQRDP